MNDKSTPRDTLLEAVAKLPREIALSRDLWPGIATQLARDSNKVSLRQHVIRSLHWHAFNWRMAASFTGAALGLVLAIFLGRNHHQQVESVAIDVAPISADYLPVTQNAQYRAARAPLLMAFTESLGTLSPTERAKVEQGLKDIQQGLQALNAASHQHPDNLTLQHLVLSTYQRELEYMQSITALTKHLPEDTTL